MITSNVRKRINLGCGKYPLDGYTNVNLHEPADIMADIWDCAFHDLTEVRMDHVLEHVPWTQTGALLMRINSWMEPGALLVIEVPDMEAIMRRGPTGDWLRYVYGSQQHEGEFHRAGFTMGTLMLAIREADFRNVEVEAFESTFRTRQGMPCLRAEAFA